MEKNLLSLSFLRQRKDAEIIYIDNASTDRTIGEITRLYPDITVFQNAENTGVSVARNQGIQKATGEYIWMLDSDTEVSETAINAMLAFMDKHPEAGLCGCKMYGQDGRVQPSCRKFPSIAGKIKTGIRIIANKLKNNTSSRLKNDYDTDAEQPFEVDYVIGACQLIRKEAQKKAGELDEHIFYGPEDADFCLRIKQAGYRVFYLPQTAIYHAYQRVSSHKVFSKLTWKHLQGLAYYFWKHR